MGSAGTAGACWDRWSACVASLRYAHMCLEFHMPRKVDGCHIHIPKHGALSAVDTRVTNFPAGGSFRIRPGAPGNMTASRERRRFWLVGADGRFGPSTLASPIASFESALGIQRFSSCKPLPSCVIVSRERSIFTDKRQISSDKIKQFQEWSNLINSKTTR